MVLFTLVLVCVCVCVCYSNLMIQNRPTKLSGQPGRHHSFVEIDHEILSMVLFSLPLIQEGQLSVSGE